MKVAAIPLMSSQKRPSQMCPLDKFPGKKVGAIPSMPARERPSGMCPMALVDIISGSLCRHETCSCQDG
ncbi:hypothetical protein AQUCO_01100116v1 [Aquilegia coerulea]|uniref:Uncharacterized protein n=1 Tax=Aquilegia coerulea TaxID=218851 RepID=A0A2G5E5P1_AQUCA|nr:hypothetical protein AQUCO_01100116v1 [Aquilegia coerulea]